MWVSGNAGGVESNANSEMLQNINLLLHLQRNKDLFLNIEERMHLAQVQLFKSLIFWSKNGCLDFLYEGGCLKQVRWNIFWRCLYVTAVPWPWDESRPWAGRRQLVSSRRRIWRETGLERDCHPANSPVRWQVTAAMEFERHIFWHTRFERLTQPHTSPALRDKQRAGFRERHSGKIIGETPHEKASHGMVLSFTSLPAFLFSQC